MQNRRALGICAAATLALTACAENNTSLFVEAVLKSDPPECDFQADPGATRLSSGQMDVAYTLEYRAMLLVASQLSPRGAKDQLRAESMGVQVRGAEVRLTDSTGDLIDEFSVPAGGHVTPSGSEAPGFGLTEVTLIPTSVGDDLVDSLDWGESQKVVVEVRVFGDTEGGSDLTSGSHNFVVDVCHGCSYTIPEGGALIDDNGAIRCNAVYDGASIGTCFFGQDGPSDCRNCQSRECPPTL